MINETDNHVAWVLLIDELDEAREHLTELTNRMYHDGRIDESEYAVRLGHIYAHLNRAGIGGISLATIQPTLRGSGLGAFRKTYRQWVSSR